jgi:exopolysaccharide biosynthesis WecB/TagA/CpsF family protein
MSDVCRLAAKEGLPVYFYGSKQETLVALGTRLVDAYPGLVIAGHKASRFRPVTEEEQLSDAEAILASGARIVFAGLGCPRQEIWTHAMRGHLSLPVLAVGAAFDFHAGTVRRAPEWMQKRGLEWFFRLLQEPRRLWRRYLLLNPAFLALVVLQITGLKRIPSHRPHQLLAAIPG